jgi:HD-GYP domain-containing protein (c-di-GMP phosphodiesterase class II)
LVNLSRGRIIDLYVGLVALLTICMVGVAYFFRVPAPGPLAFLSLCLVAVLLDRSPDDARVGASGSTSFIIHIAAGVLFGGFWGALIAGTATCVTQFFRRSEPKKLVFNVAQRALAVASAVLIYQFMLGGSIRPSYLSAGDADMAIVQREIFSFFVLATTYVLVNLTSVSAAVSLSANRPFREVWHLNVRGIVGYDVGASVLSLIVALVYVKAETWGWGPLAIVAMTLPIVAVRHFYALYHSLENSGQELLELMVKAIEARDPYTSGHSIRVRELSRAIALELQLSAREIEEVETAALLHDVGKIHEEFAPLLRKESRLTPEETSLMQTHAAKSADLVGIISRFRGSIQRAVRHHHERWDGEGYPDGVKGKDIPLASRIIIISDTIDAMTTDRPYRKRLPLEVVVAELQKCRGTQFDPELVDVVVSSVAVRRLILGAEPEGANSLVPMRSRKASVLPAAFWRRQRA